MYTDGGERGGYVLLTCTLMDGSEGLRFTHMYTDGGERGGYVLLICTLMEGSEGATFYSHVH